MHGSRADFCLLVANGESRRPTTAASWQLLGVDCNMHIVCEPVLYIIS